MDKLFQYKAETALSEVLKAKEAWIASARDNGIEIPKPVYRPAIYQVS